MDQEKAASGYLIEPPSRGGLVLALAVCALLLAACGTAISGESVAGGVPVSPETTTTSSTTSTTTTESTTVSTTTEETSTEETAEREDNESAGESAVDGRELGGTLDGSAEITLTSYDYCGPGGGHRAIGTQTYSLPARLIIAPPKQADGNVESNPFSLELHAGAANANGAVSVASSLVLSSHRLLVQYWRLSYSDGQLSGTLVDTHLREAAAYNLFNGIKLLVPCRPEMGTLPGGFPSAIDTGASLRGTLTGTGADIVVEAATVDRLFALRLRFAG